MISHQYRCVFIHIPKCAGTSIESALGHLEGHSGRGGQDHRTIRMLEPLFTPKVFSSTENVYETVRRLYRGSKPVANPRNKYTLTKAQYSSYYKFSFVRNPWARAYSWYANVMRDKAHQDALGVTEKTPLNEFLQRYAGKGMLRPQLYWLKDFSGSVPLDFIGKFESLAEDFQKACDEMGIPHIELPHKVQGSGKSYHDHYDEDSVALIAEVYQEEIERFGYTFEPQQVRAPL